MKSIRSWCVSERRDTTVNDAVIALSIESNFRQNKRLYFNLLSEWSFGKTISCITPFELCHCSWWRARLKTGALFLREMIGNPPRQLIDGEIFENAEPERIFAKNINYGSAVFISRVNNANIYSGFIELSSRTTQHANNSQFRVGLKAKSYKMILSISRFSSLISLIVETVSKIE